MYIYTHIYVYIYIYIEREREDQLTRQPEEGVAHARASVRHTRTTLQRFKDPDRCVSHSPGRV